MCYKIIPYAMVLFLAVSGISCQKELSLTSDDRPALNRSINAFFSENTAEAVQTFSMNAGNGGRITGNKGTRVSFQPGSFTDRSGKPVSGNVQLQLIEILTPADMILNNKVTMSNGLPIESGGAFYVNATYNNGKDTALLAPGRLVQFGLTVPSAALPDMQVFTGDLSTVPGSINWAPNTAQGNIVRADTFALVNMFSTTMEWINCDRFMKEPDIRFTFEPGDAPDVDSTLVFIHFTGRNSVMSIRRDAGNRFMSDQLIAAPVTVVGVCMANGSIYSAVGSTALTHNGSHTLQFTPTTEEALKAKLALLK